MDAKTKHDTDIDPMETSEWLDALSAVIHADGPERAHYLLERMVDVTRRAGAHLPYDATTAYVNTIPPNSEERSPGNAELEWRIRSIIRWNAMAMVVRANRKDGSIGGHISSFASAATLYDVGFNHFFRGANEDFGGDLLYIQGHSAPGIYARAYLEGRLNEDQLDRFRREVDGDGLSSYPHPWLMPDFWQLPTVSMGLGPIMSIYQARFLRYLGHRELAKTEAATRHGESDSFADGRCFCCSKAVDATEGRRHGLVHADCGRLHNASREQAKQVARLLGGTVPRHSKGQKATTRWRTTRRSLQRSSCSAARRQRPSA